ncbi:hypothetical protein ACFLZV_00100, partial [Candidatus Margulisiibacteriota bacterium]
MVLLLFKEIFKKIIAVKEAPGVLVLENMSAFPEKVDEVKEEPFEFPEEALVLNKKKYVFRALSKEVLEYKKSFGNKTVFMEAYADSLLNEANKLTKIIIYRAKEANEKVKSKTINQALKIVVFWLQKQLEILKTIEKMVNQKKEFAKFLKLDKKFTVKYGDVNKDYFAARLNNILRIELKNNLRITIVDQALSFIKESDKGGQKNSVRISGKKLKLFYNNVDYAKVIQEKYQKIEKQIKSLKNLFDLVMIEAKKKLSHAKKEVDEKIKTLKELKAFYKEMGLVNDGNEYTVFGWQEKALSAFSCKYLEVQDEKDRQPQAKKNIINRYA